jgi:flagellar protein FliO/FliZ
MFGTLFGAEMPLAVRFFLAFLIVLGLIGATAWAVRRFGAGRLGGASTRGRQPRLAVIDHASVDARRRLILVRRDNVEHLLMIGGPTDVVVESNIVRAAAAAPRDIPVVRPPAAEPLPRAIPLPENGGASWPLQPEPAAPVALPPQRPTPKFEPAAEEPQQWPLQPQAETPPPRPARESLSALADELAARPTPPRSRTPATMRTPPSEPRNQPRAEPQVDARQEPRAEPRVEQREPRIDPRLEPRAEPPRVEAREEVRPEPRVEARMPAPPPAEEDGSADQSLAEMAHRLEAALRKPNAPAEPRVPAEPRAPSLPPRAATPPAPPAPERAPPPPRATRTAEPKPARAADAKPGQGKTLYDSLEQEMASLLGRPTNKN